jgi:hypothetical protein
MFHFEKKKIEAFFGLKKQRIYCRTCGDDLTEIGALITEEGETYCHDFLPCLEKGLLQGENKFIPELDFVSFRDIQEEIKKGVLNSYQHF